MMRWTKTDPLVKERIWSRRYVQHTYPIFFGCLWVDEVALYRMFHGTLVKLFSRKTRTFFTFLNLTFKLVKLDVCFNYKLAVHNPKSPNQLTLQRCNLRDAFHGTPKQRPIWVPFRGLCFPAWRVFVSREVRLVEETSNKRMRYTNGTIWSLR